MKFISLNIDHRFFLQSTRLPCVTAIKVPVGVDWKQVADYAMTKFVIFFISELIKFGKLINIPVPFYDSY